PTQGFSNSADFYLGESQVDTEADEEALDASADSVEEEEQVTEEQEEEEAETALNLLPESHDTNGLGNWGWLILIIVVIAVVFLYLFRNQLRTKRVTYKMDKTPDLETFQEAYHHVMKLLQRKGHIKAPDQTLREFARMVD
ncbi:peptidase, partial [Pseudoalteromonas sp. 2103]|nr:peptidase [Pseudoalteromonas sp. 2103]